MIAKTVPEVTPQSRLSAFCGGLIEACWLAAVVVVPLAYNPHAVHGFQPFKMAVLRLIALMLAGAWVVRIAERGLPVGGFRCATWPLVARQLFACLALLTGAHVLSLAVSVHPAQSFHGLSATGEGLVGALAFVVILAAVAFHLRTTGQLYRLVAAMVLPTIPLCFLAILQRAGFDPLGIARADPTYGLIGTIRVMSLAGHPISLAGYLAMVVPFTLWLTVRIHASARGLQRGLMLGVMAILLILQVAGFLFANSRGPVVALLAVLTVFGIAAAAIRGWRRMIRGVLILAAGVILILSGFALMNRWIPDLKRVPVIGRFALIVPVGAVPDGFRVSLWKAAPGVILARPPLEFPDGRKDALAGIRILSGYGSDTLPGVLPEYWTWVGASARFEKSFHNLAWDTWFGLGALGVIGLLSAFCLGALGALRNLGLSPGRRQLFTAGIVVAATCAGSIGVYGWGFLGLGLQLGISCGLILIAAWGGMGAGSGSGAKTMALPVSAACAAALVGHLVNTAFAFSVAGTSLMVVISLGLVVAESRGLGEDGGGSCESRARGADWTFPLLGALAFTAMGFGLVHLRSRDGLPWHEILTISLTRIVETRGASHLISLCLLPAAWMTIFLAVVMGQLGGERAGFAALRMLGAIVAFAVGFAVFCAGWIAKAGPLEPSRAFQYADAMGFTAVAFLVFMGLLTLLVGATCMARPAPGAPLWSMRGFVSCGLAALAVAAAAWMLAGRPTLAESDASLALLLSANGAAEEGAPLMVRASKLDPLNPEWPRVYAEFAEGIAGARGGEVGICWLDEARKILIEACKQSRLNSLPSALASVSMRRAFLASEPGTARDEARRYFAEAARIDPSSELVWADSALVDEILFGDIESASKKMREADRLAVAATADTGEEWGDRYARRVETAANPHAQAIYAKRAFHHWQKAIPWKRGYHLPVSPVYLKMTFVAAQAGDASEAIGFLRAAVQAADGPDLWRAQMMLAKILYDSKQSNREALDMAMQAAKAAPPEVKPALDDLKLKLILQR